MSGEVQDSVFLDGEGDRWFSRNQTALDAADRAADDPVIAMLEFAGVQPNRVLEVGASNGWRLHAMQQKYNCHATGLEPSLHAIESGRARHPNVEYLHGVASDLGKYERTYDLVVAAFVFHWIDRNRLFESIAGVDRSIAPDGYLIIADFRPDSPQKVKYHHLPDQNVWTWKQDYSQVFLASSLYSLVAASTFAHDAHRFGWSDAEGNRANVALLRKTGPTGYREVVLK